MSPNYKQLVDGLLLVIEAVRRWELEKDCFKHNRAGGEAAKYQGKAPAAAGESSDHEPHAVRSGEKVQTT